jgi:hypothetical protein
MIALPRLLCVAVLSAALGAPALSQVQPADGMRQAAVTYEVISHSEGREGGWLPRIRIEFDFEKKIYIAADTQVRLQTCTMDPQYFCVKASGFRFAVPRIVEKGRSTWTVDGVEYRIEQRSASLTLLGVEIDDVMSIVAPVSGCDSKVAQRCPSEQRYLFSSSRGLIASRVTVYENDQRFEETRFLVGRCGVAAPPSCN